MVLALVTGYALWAGDRVVRAAALIHAANWLLLGVFQPRHDHNAFAWADFLVDVLGALAITALALGAKRTWLALMAAFLLLGVSDYASSLTELRGWRRATVTADYLWGFGALASLWVGAHAARRRRSAAGDPAGSGAR